VLPDSELLSITVTFGIKAPLGSATVPVISPEMVVCAQAEEAQTNKAKPNEAQTNKAKPNEAQTTKYLLFTIPSPVFLNFRETTPPRHTQTYITPLEMEDWNVSALKVFTGGLATKGSTRGIHLNYWHM
jgi:hypothetical protein